LQYKILTAAAAAGILGAQQAYDKLKVRFEAQGGGGRTMIADNIDQ
jgi:hypothetical protein